MTIVLLSIGLVLLVAVLGLVYRVITLVSIAKGSDRARVSTSNKVNAILFPLMFILGFGAIFWYSGIAQEYFLPEAASEHGKVTDKLFWITMGVIFFAFFVTHVLLFFFPFTYQYGEHRKAKFYPHNDRLELIWTIIPAVVMTVLVISGWKVWTDITGPAPEDKVELEIMGKQFNWQVRYPGKDGRLGVYDFRKIDATNSMGVDFTDPNSMDDFMPREIHIPKGRPVLLNIRSRDVLHSVFLPHFRAKMDAVPGMPTQFWFTPTKTTEEMRQELGNPEFNYELACTEVCGNGHFAMKFIVVVDEPEEFEKWYSEQESWASKNQDYLASKGIHYNSQNIAYNVNTDK